MWDKIVEIGSQQLKDSVSFYHSKSVIQAVNTMNNHLNAINKFFVYLYKEGIADNIFTPFSEKCSHCSFSKFWCIFKHFLIFRAIWATVFRIFPTEYWKNLGWELEKGYPFDWVAFSIFSYTLYLIVYYRC